MIENQKKKIWKLKMVQEWNSQLAKARWCQRERWHVYCMWRILLFCGSGSYWRHKV